MASRCARHASVDRHRRGRSGADRRLLEALPTGATATRRCAARRGDGRFSTSPAAPICSAANALLDDILSRFFHQGFDVRAGLPRHRGLPGRRHRFCACNLSDSAVPWRSDADASAAEVALASATARLEMAFD